MHIPIIGNGDITSPEICRRRFEETGVDAVMIGRATIGHPWFFEEIKHFINEGQHIDEFYADKPSPEGIQPYSFRWKLDILKQQVNQSVERLDERRGIIHIRRHLAATPLFKGIPNFRDTRIAMLRAETVEELFRIFDTIQDV